MKRLTSVPDSINVTSFFCVALFLLGACVLKSGWDQFDFPARLNHEPETVAGTITEHTVIKTKNSAELDLDYEYHDGSGRLYQGEDEVSSETFEQFPDGSQILVTFIKSDPSQHTLDGIGPIINRGRGLCVYGGTVLFIALLLLPKSISIILINRALVRRGIKCQAKLTDVRQAVRRTSKAEYTDYFIDFEYLDTTGQKHLATKQVETVAIWIMALEQEIPVDMVYLPENPEKFRTLIDRRKIQSQGGKSPLFSLGS